MHMRAIFRVNGSHTIGFGHIARCQNLAAALTSLGYACQFVRSGTRDEVLDGLDVAWLDINENDVGRQLDADLTTSAATAAGISSTVVVVDDYRIDSGWESVVRDAGALVVAIDDLADRPHVCHVLIDANPLSLDRYQGLVSPDTLCLLGLGYALLDPKRSDRPLLYLDAERSPERVLVCFGGGSNEIAIRMMLKASEDPRIQHLTFDVVTADNALAESLRTARTGRRKTSGERVRIWGWVEDMRERLQECDISVGSGGSLAIERIRFGIPSVVVTLADHQVPTTRALHQLGLLRHIGNLSACSAQVLADEVFALAFDEQARATVRRDGPRTLDGHGALRCAQAIYGAHRTRHSGKQGAIC